MAFSSSSSLLSLWDAGDDTNKAVCQQSGNREARVDDDMRMDKREIDMCWYGDSCEMLLERKTSTNLSVVFVGASTTKIFQAVIGREFVM